MKTFIIAILLSLTTTVSFSSNYCDHKRSSIEVQRCYNAAIETAQQQHDRAYHNAMANPRLNEASKDLLESDTINFFNRVNSQCRNQACVFNSLMDRSRVVNNFVATNVRR